MSGCETGIVIVGGNRFQNELMAEILVKEFGVQCDIAEHAGMFPRFQLGFRKILVLVDYNQTAGNPVKVPAESPKGRRRNFVALFNVRAGAGVEEAGLIDGVRGFFYEHDSMPQFLKGIRTILSGQLWVSREIVTRCLVRNNPRGGRASHIRRRILSRRERQILEEVARGASNKEVAEKLCISVHTVKTHLYNSYQKVKAKNRLEAVSWMSRNL